jgi:hypothetical protein
MWSGPGRILTARRRLPYPFTTKGRLFLGTGIAKQVDSNGFGCAEISEADLKSFDPAVLVERLVAGGISRLGAERMVAIKRGLAEPSRARTHMQSRR